MNLNEMLLKEQLRLEKIVKEAGARLKNAPEGTLRLSGCRKSIQYYRCLPGGRKNGEYLPKSREKLIRALAQKSYDEKVVRLAEKRLAQIRDILADYEDDEFEKLLLAEHPERQKLIRPAEISWEQRLKKWLSEEYTGKAFQKGAPVILTERGERVRSKSEKILADLFFRRGIPYKYECPLYLKGYGTVHPDFTFLSERTGMEIYWEHASRMDEPEYAGSAVRKIQAYEENGIYPGDRLILTFETETSLLDTKLAEQLAEKYLLKKKEIHMPGQNLQK